MTMNSYAFWNNKGGVGKSFLCFVAATEYAHHYPDVDVYVIDLCPQANVSETLLGGNRTSPGALDSLLGHSPRRTIAGYLEARLNSPFQMVQDISSYVCRPQDYNPDIPKNLQLVSGDNLVELLAEAVRQTSQLSIPTNAWRQVITWVRDLSHALAKVSGPRDSIVLLDCNPSFAMYTQLALVAAQSLIVPYTADDSSRRAIENIAALLYGLGSSHVQAYSSISFSQKAKDEGVDLPKIHTLVSNRVTMYEGRPSKAFEAASQTIKNTVADLHRRRRTIFAKPSQPSAEFAFDIPDYHSACVASAMNGIPLHRLKAGPHMVAGMRVQINPDPLKRYRNALELFVQAL
jgi:cellulose biosynthesis protein BcsQ